MADVRPASFAFVERERNQRRGLGSVLKPRVWLGARRAGGPSDLRRGLALGRGAADTVERVTTREKLHRLVDELSDAEVEAALTRLVRDREALERWAASADAGAVEDAWALANAREAIREEPW